MMSSASGDETEKKGTGLARIAIDRGGTFTDVICSRPDQDDIVFKVRPAGIDCKLTGIVVIGRSPKLPRRTQRRVSLNGLIS